jgi:subtilisin family serine protease
VNLLPGSEGPRRSQAAPTPVRPETSVSPGFLALAPLVVGLLLAALAAPALAQADGRVAASLRQRAAETGSVPVLVELATETLPEGRISAWRDRLRQRERIDADQGALEAQLEGTRYEIRRRFESVPFLALEAGPEALERLAASPEVAFVDEDRLHRPLLDKSVPQVGGDRVHGLGLRGDGQVVAILDTGVDAAHPDLAGRVVAEACFSASRSCPNHQRTQFGPGAGIYCDYAHACFHGTHVAGIAAGAGDPYTGVAPAAGVISIQIFSMFTGPICGNADACPLAYTSDQVAALEYVYDSLRHELPIAAVNLSLGGTLYRNQLSCDLANAATKLAVDNLRAVGIATVVSAGNNGARDGLSEPACISSTVSVGAVSDNDIPANFSNRAPFLSLWAPGTKIRAPLYKTQTYKNAAGTSMAAPHVTGAWALLRQADPEASVDALLATLRATGAPVKNDDNGAPRLAVREAVATLLDECGDGVDNDGDGRVDYPFDPGCRDAFAAIENAPCDDGIDNDADGTADFAGVDLDGDGVLDLPPDEMCEGQGWYPSELTGLICGLGFESVLVLLPWAWLRARRQRARAAGRRPV